MAAGFFPRVTFRLKVEIVRRWCWCRTVFASVDWAKLILASALVSTAFHVFLTYGLPPYSSDSFFSPSVSLSYATDGTVAAAVQSPSPVPSSLVAVPRQSPAPPEAPSLSSHYPNSSFSHNSIPVGASVSKHSTENEISNVRSSDSSGSKVEVFPSPFFKNFMFLVSFLSCFGWIVSTHLAGDLGIVQRPLRWLPTDDALAYAKSEIERAPIIYDDPDLHPPLFRNVSIFKRCEDSLPQLVDVGEVFPPHILSNSAVLTLMGMLSWDNAVVILQFWYFFCPEILKNQMGLVEFFW